MITDKCLQNLKQLIETAGNKSSAPPMTLEKLHALFDAIAEDYLVLAPFYGYYKIKHLLWTVNDLRPCVLDALSRQVQFRLCEEITEAVAVETCPANEAPLTDETTLRPLDLQAENQKTEGLPKTWSAPANTNSVQLRKDWFDAILDWAAGFVTLFMKQSSELKG
jgi:hypothetical protein